VADGVPIRRRAMQRQHVGAVSWEKTRAATMSTIPMSRNRAGRTLGMPILIDMKKKPGVDTWEGQVYNAKDAVLQLHDQALDPDHMEFRAACWGFLCGGETWTRSQVRFPRAPSTAWQGRSEGCTAHGPKASAAPKPRSIGSIKGQKHAITPRRRHLAYSPISRGFAHSAGWNSSTAAKVVTSDSASSCPC